MTHFPEGFQVQQWPEFRALAKRLGIPDNKLHSRITIVAGGVEELVMIRHEYQNLETPAVDPTASTCEGSLVTSFALYRWPEFQAFCDRIGFGYDLYTLAFEIEIPDEGELVKIRQTYWGIDTKAPQPKMLDTGIKNAKDVSDEIERMVLEGSPVVMQEDEMTGPITITPVPENPDAARGITKEAWERATGVIENTTLHNEYYRTHQPRAAK